MSSVRTLPSIVGIGVLILVCGNVLQAQEQQIQTPIAPPPAKVISAEERNILAQAGDNKSRLKKTLELAERHLLEAETYTTQEKHEEASAELGKYWALIEDVLRNLNPLNTDKTKTRDLYKRLELALRAHGTRLALMRRNTPLEYAVWVKEIEEFTRSSRTEALNSFYGHTVVREASTPETVDVKTPKNGLTAPENRQP